MHSVMHVDLSVARVRAFRTSKGWSINALAAAAGLGESTIRRIDDPDWSPTVRILRKLEAVIPPGFEAPVDQADAENVASRPAAIHGNSRGGME
jgi:transcriptional regulator with XRE-family HTH domain